MNIRLLCAMLIVLSLISAGAGRCADLENPPVLAIDFTGLLDNRPGQHADQFQQALLPEASVYSVGFHGVIPDNWRQNAGYSAIVRYQTEADRSMSADTVYEFAKGHKTLLAFDINEFIIPQQVRRWISGYVDLTNPKFSWLARWLLPNKIEGPALVAAQVVERWIKEHPNGIVMLRGHSDGTYALAKMLDELQAKGISPHVVFVESRRQSVGEWLARAGRAVHTTFIEIAAEGDLPIEAVLDLPRAPAFPKNFIRYQITGNRDWLSAHSVVTDWRSRLNAIRMDQNSRIAMQNITLADNMVQEVSRYIASPVQRNDRSTVARNFATVSPAERRAAAEAELARLQTGVVFWRQTAEDVQKVLDAFVTAYKDDTSQRAGDRNTMRVLALVTKLRTAMDEDIVRAASHQLVQLSPKTVEGLAEVAVEIMAWVHESPLLGAAPDKAERLMNRFGGLSMYTSAFGQIAGGQYDAETMNLIMGGSSELVKQSILDEIRLELRAKHGVDKLVQEIRDLRVYQKSRWENRLFSLSDRAYKKGDLRLHQATREIARREARLVTQLAEVELGLARASGGLLFLDVIVELSSAIAQHAARGYLSIEDADRYSDAAITLIATIMVMPMLLSPNAAYAPAAREAIVAGARFVRKATEDASIYSFALGEWRNFWRTLVGQSSPAIEIYMEYQSNQFRQGKIIEPIDVFYTKKERQLHGITQSVVDLLNEMTNLKNSRLQGGNYALPSTTQSTHAAMPRPKIKAKDPEISPVEEPRAKKPWKLWIPFYPPPGRGGPPGAVDSGDGPDGKGVDDDDRKDEPPPPPSPAVLGLSSPPREEAPGQKESGVTVNPANRYVPLQAYRLLDAVQGRP